MGHGCVLAALPLPPFPPPPRLGGTTTPSPCGNETVYCPTGSGTPQVVQAGYYSDVAVAAGVERPAAPLTLSLMSRQVQCPKGYFCTGGQQVACPPSTYQDQVRKTGPGDCLDCPAGYFCGMCMQWGREDDRDCSVHFTSLDSRGWSWATLALAGWATLRFRPPQRAHAMPPLLCTQLIATKHPQETGTDARAGVSANKCKDAAHNAQMIVWLGSKLPPIEMCGFKVAPDG